MAGNVILQYMKNNNIMNAIVVVSRWYSGKLHNRRFQIFEHMTALSLGHVHSYNLEQTISNPVFSQGQYNQSQHRLRNTGNSNYNMHANFHNNYRNNISQYSHNDYAFKPRSRHNKRYTYMDGQKVMVQI